MKTNKKNVLRDLKLLIDISCLKGENIRTFELFHKMLIRIYYKAADVTIDYDRKRIYMGVITEDIYYDLDKLNPQFEPTMSVNMTYKNLNTFLKKCILQDADSLNYYYPTLISRFFKRTKVKKAVESLQSA